MLTSNQKSLLGQISLMLDSDPDLRVALTGALRIGAEQYQRDSVTCVTPAPGFPRLAEQFERQRAIASAIAEYLDN